MHTIARSFCLAFSVVLEVHMASAQLLTENFNYGAADNSDIRKVAIVGSDTVWTRQSGSQGPQYTSSGLSFPGYALSGIGGSLRFTRGSSGVNDGDVHRKFSDSVATTSNIYVSFMVRVDSASATPDYFFHLGPYVLGTTFRCRVFGRVNGSGWSLGLSKSTETRVDDNTVLNVGTTYLIILKYSFNTAATNDDVVTLYLYSGGVPSSEPGSPLVTLGPVGSGTTGDPVSIGAVAVRQGTATPSGQIDGIRVATSFASIITSVEWKDVRPARFALQQNYPNPFNPATSIRYEISHTVDVSLRIFDVLGREVAVLVQGVMEPGIYQVTWDAKDRPSGVYFYQLRGGSFVETKSMVLTK